MNVYFPFILVSLLSDLRLSYCFGPVKCSSGNWIKLKILFHCSSSFMTISKSLFLVMNCQQIKSWNHDNRNCKWDSCALILWGHVSSIKRKSQYPCTIDVIIWVIWISPAWTGMGLVCSETTVLFQEFSSFG